jgi:hypothetical protein
MVKRLDGLKGRAKISRMERRYQRLCDLEADIQD